MAEMDPLNCTSSLRYADVHRNSQQTNQSFLLSSNTFILIHLTFPKGNSLFLSHSPHHLPIYTFNIFSSSSHFSRVLDSCSAPFHKMPQRKGCSVFNEPCFVAKKFLARPQHEGVGAVVRRSIGR